MGSSEPTLQDTRAKVTEEQLKRARSLEGATMPDGEKRDDEALGQISISRDV